MGNRVEDLEKQVAELQATIDGLTEELVETKERVRQLEGATDLSAEPATDGGDSGDDHAEFVPNADTTPDVDSDTGSTDESTAEQQGDDESDSDDDDGIIVA